MDSENQLSNQAEASAASDDTIDALRAKIDELAKQLEAARVNTAEQTQSGLRGGLMSGLMSARAQDGGPTARLRAARAAAETGDRAALLEYLRIRHEPAD